MTREGKYACALTKVNILTVAFSVSVRKHFIDQKQALCFIARSYFILSEFNGNVIICSHFEDWDSFFAQRYQF